MKRPGYDMSFTAVSLRVNEAVRMIQVAREQGITDLKLLKDKGNIIGGGNSRTTDRQFRELRKRLELLSPKQQELLATGTLNTQKQLCFLAICKLYAFLKDFTVEVIREKFLIFDYLLTDTDYDIFFRRKLEEHPELEVLTETTTRKIRQVSWRMLEQAGWIDSVKTRVIQMQFPEQQLINVIMDDNPEWLKIFLFTDHQINNLSRI